MDINIVIFLIFRYRPGNCIIAVVERGEDVVGTWEVSVTTIVGGASVKLLRDLATSGSADPRNLSWPLTGEGPCCICQKIK